MSKYETPMTLRYWEKVGGILIEEFVATKETSDNGCRVLDAVIIKSEENRIVKQDEVSLRF